ncbi:hypothetical protein OFO07_03495 [Campylobacter sp. JMF_06 NA1]|uniref:hypothetical protein n=1 Tax=Campylobacter sp. JMF_06 NA1 TaxID=2983823 RepID=UPI0022E9AE9F|nr:hypothetical protein [Campylobacter sp. JMF_06 NA1]MDA3077989.1 hypothetical protein [Campylobacter sp. JMF_06 NA1]
MVFLDYQVSQDGYPSSPHDTQIYKNNSTLNLIKRFFAPLHSAQNDKKRNLFNFLKNIQDIVGVVRRKFGRFQAKLPLGGSQGRLLRLRLAPLRSPATATKTFNKFESIFISKFKKFYQI